MKTFFARIVFNAPLVALAALGLAAASGAQTLNDAPNFWGVTEGNGLVVAVGEQGAIFLRDRIGGAWRKGFAGAPVWLLGVAYGNGMFVAVGAGGAVLTSPDGVVWTARTVGVSSRLQNIAFGDGRFVAVSDAGDILTSSDARTWTARPSGTSMWLRGVTRGEGLWLVTGANGTVLTSPDSVTWTRRTSGVTTGLDSVFYGHTIGYSKVSALPPQTFSGPNRYIVVGEAGTCLVSDDGITWNQGKSGTTEWLRAVAVGYGVTLSAVPPVVSGKADFAIMGDSGAMRFSPDGLTWSARQAPAAGYSLRAAVSAVAGPGSSFVDLSAIAVGASGTVFDGKEGNKLLTWLTAPAQGHRFVNLATRGTVGADAAMMIAGFVISGDRPSRCLVRAVGPSLAAFGVTGTLADPQLAIFDSKGRSIAVNDNWGGAAAIRDAAQAAGAFPLAADSADAAIIVTLQPGSYTAQVSGVNNSTGVALVEVYELR